MDVFKLSEESKPRVKEALEYSGELLEATAKFHRSLQKFSTGEIDSHEFAAVIAGRATHAMAGYEFSDIYTFLIHGQEKQLSAQDKETAAINKALQILIAKKKG